MKIFKRIMLMVLFVFASLSLIAAEPQAAEDETTSDAAGDLSIQPDEQADSEQDSEEVILSDEELEGEGPGRFIPTEQISQDLGVSFPVDI